MYLLNVIKLPPDPLTVPGKDHPSVSLLPLASRDHPWDKIELYKNRDVIIGRHWFGAFREKVKYGFIFNQKFS